MALFNRYLYLFTCLIFSVVLISSNANAGKINGYSYTPTVNPSTGSIDLNAFKDGKKYITAIKSNPAKLAGSLLRSSRMGFVGVLIAAATIYGMVYNPVDNLFEKMAENGLWEWSYIGTTSSDPKVVAAAFISRYKQSNPNTSVYNYEVQVEGKILSVRIFRNADDTIGYIPNGGSILGQPVENPPSKEIFSIDQISKAIINDAFPDTVPNYNPTQDAIDKARKFITDIYDITESSPDTVNDPIAKDIADALIIAQPESKDQDIKVPAVPDTGVIGSLPNFCSWATPICDAITSVKEFFYNPEPPECDDYSCNNEEIPIHDVERPKDVGLNATLLNGYSAQCPADEVVSLEFLGNRSFSFSYVPLCEFALKINPLVVLMGYLVAGFMFVNSLRS